MSAILRLILRLQLGGSGGLEAPPGATIERVLHCKVVPGVTQNPLNVFAQHSGALENNTWSKQGSEIAGECNAEWNNGVR